MAQNTDLVDHARRFMHDEYFDWTVYTALAEHERDDQRRELLRSLAETELQHYEFWKSITNGEARKVNRVAVALLLMMRRVAGLVFTMKFLELHEHKVVEAYKRWLPQLNVDRQSRLQAIIEDEEKHEEYFVSQVDEAIIRYIGFIALGLSDAIIEVTGVHAGFLGVMQSTLVAGIAGLIVGFAASISMGVAAYLKAKSESRKSPMTSAFITSFSYLLAVVFLAAPYFMTHDMFIAFGASVILAVLMSVAFTFYVSVVNETNFKREVMENTLLLLGTAFATYLFGDFLRNIFNIEQLF